MRTLRALLAHELAGSGMRYVIAGGIVAVVYLGVPIALNGGAGVPIEVAIAIAYVLAVTLHFNLQRHFVFRHVGVFELSRRAQIGRYIMMGAVQYPTTAVATALLPKVLGLSSRATFVVVSLVMSATLFIVLRTHIFQSHGGDVPARHPGGSGTELEVGELQFGGRRGDAGEGEADAVETPVQRDREADALTDDRHRDPLLTRGADADPQR
jgi:putative flippase GtrA